MDCLFHLSLVPLLHLGTLLLPASELQKSVHLYIVLLFYLILCFLLYTIPLPYYLRHLETSAFFCASSLRLWWCSFGFPVQPSLYILSLLVVVELRFLVPYMAKAHLCSYLNTHRAFWHCYLLYR